MKPNPAFLGRLFGASLERVVIGEEEREKNKHRVFNRKTRSPRGFKGSYKRVLLFLMSL